MMMMMIIMMINHKHFKGSVKMCLCVLRHSLPGVCVCNGELISVTLHVSFLSSSILGTSSQDC